LDQSLLKKKGIWDQSQPITTNHLPIGTFSIVAGALPLSASFSAATFLAVGSKPVTNSDLINENN
jgi:hypothetical protein